jgi:hypothetical protein
MGISDSKSPVAAMKNKLNCILPILTSPAIELRQGYALDRGTP